jgi:hypothetical protein
LEEERRNFGGNGSIFNLLANLVQVICGSGSGSFLALGILNFGMVIKDIGGFGGCFGSTLDPILGRDEVKTSFNFSLDPSRRCGEERDFVDFNARDALEYSVLDVLCASEERINDRD